MADILTVRDNLTAVAEHASKIALSKATSGDSPAVATVAAAWLGVAQGALTALHTAGGPVPRNPASGEAASGAVSWI